MTTNDVAVHYGTDGLLDRILGALVQAGKDLNKLTIDDLRLVDEFHSRRRRATEELARMLAPSASGGCVAMTRLMMSSWQRPHACFATRRSPGFMNRMNSADSWFSQTFEFGGFADVFQNSLCRGGTCAGSFVKPRAGLPPWQSVQPRTTCDAWCIGSTPW